MRQLELCHHMHKHAFCLLKLCSLHACLMCHRAFSGNACFPRSFDIPACTALQGVTTCLFPLTVVKTRQMAIQGAPTGLWVSSKLTLGSQSPLDQQTCFTLRMCAFCVSMLYLHANRLQKVVQCVVMYRVLRRQPELY